MSLGSIGRRHLRNVRKLLPDARIGVLRLHDRKPGPPPDGADAVFTAREPALDFEADAAIIASPASMHVMDAKLLLANDAHLFIEKPLAGSLAQLEGFEAVANASSRFMMVGYVLRFLPLLQCIRRTVQEGSLGRVWTAHAQVGQYLPDWRPSADYRVGVSAQSELGGGALLELSHEIDYSVWLFGKPDSIQCSLGRLSNLEIDVEDSAHLLLEYLDPPKRVLIQLDLLQRVAHMSLKIVGSEATLVADLIKETALIHDRSNPQGKPLTVSGSTDGNEVYLRQFDVFFARCFPEYRAAFPETANFTGWATIDQAAHVMRVVETAREANREGRRHPLSEGSRC